MSVEQLEAKLGEVSGLLSRAEFLSPFKESVRKLEEKLKQGKLNAVFVGEFSSGKTSLINALFGLDLPTDVLPETAAIWRISISKVDKPIIEVNTTNGQKIKLEDFEEVKSYDPKQIDHIDLFINADMDEGIVIVDTPGLASLEPHHEQILRNFIDEADVLLVAVDINQGITKNLKSFIETGLKDKRRTYAVLTKSDTKPERSAQELKDYMLSEFPDFLDAVIAVSAKDGKLEELKNLLDKIAQEKEEIIAQTVSSRLKHICSDASEVVRTQLENAKLDVADIEAKMKEVLSNLNHLDEEIRNLVRKIEQEIENIAEKASNVFVSSLMKRVKWIAEGLYDENLEETIEHRFDTAVREATKEAMQVVERDVENLFAEIENIGNELAQEFNVGGSLAIRIAELVVSLREGLASLILIIVSKIPKFGPIAASLSAILGGIINSLLKGVTQTFVVDKIKDAITDPELKYKDRLEELETQKKSYELAYEELREEKKKKLEEFNNYIENLKDINRKLVLCGGEL